MKHWLVKTEPETYGWADLVSKKEDIWDGVRNYQARNFLKDMAEGDLVMVYHSGKHREVVGLAKVSEESFPDPADEEGKGWVAVRLAAENELKRPVTLQEIKGQEELSEMLLLKQSRLSVMPLTANEFDFILQLAEK
ncbi:EVE domain-containing protein [Litoribacter ruber]|uniref:EVE domain-containing protein n=1 Tax=Litoribacter ruber TaxID=702568 RepID=A0AAP2CJ82_9BACT|nr:MULTISPECIES: EVE domain-containing protein [Litoribacter]MBS9524905.1 EVE domain-containing protein [Litoribacter alkaliphilus]MBT0811934.1 EVE domain-containing protein [Litoribacter ruber]